LDAPLAKELVMEYNLEIIIAAYPALTLEQIVEVHERRTRAFADEI
jgi:hypothetical protein